MGDLIFRGVAASSLNDVFILKMPSHRKAAMRYSEYYVNGRDGALHVDEGYANFDLTVQLVLINGTANDRQIVNAWADGTGKLITSDDLTLAYMASVKEEVVWSRQVAAYFVHPFDATRTSTNKYTPGEYVRYNGSIYKFTANHYGAWNNAHAEEQHWLVGGVYDVATITFNCQPFMVEAVESEIVVTATQGILNPGSATALPLIEVNGSGNVTFSINGKEISISGMTSNVPVNIDSATGYVYTTQGAKAMTGDFPVLELGVNNITLGSGITSLRITPHWRWI